jgi:hypothetical protein
MELVHLLAMAVGLMTLVNAAAATKRYSDVASMLRQYEASNKNLVLKASEDPDTEDSDEEDGAIIQDAFLSSIIRDDGENGLLAVMMQEGDDDDDAVAQFRFIRRLVKRFRNSRFGRFVRTSPIARRIGNGLRSRFCASGK